MAKPATPLLFPQQIPQPYPQGNSPMDSQRNGFLEPFPVRPDGVGNLGFGSMPAPDAFAENADRAYRPITNLRRSR